MRTDRRNELILGVLVLVLLGVLYRAWPRTTEAVASGSPARTSAGRAPASSFTAAAVRLDTLEAERPRPGPSVRNLFRFKPKAAPAQAVAPPAPGQAEAPAGPPPPPTVPPITLKFIGIVEAPEHAQRLAVLSDDR